MQTRRVRIQIRGKVQGVFFRQSALARGSELGLTGWVRNRAGGEVEAIAEGPSDAIDAFVAWCHRGPPSAKVESVEVEALNGGPALGPFHVEATA